jgi:quercetin dioxygenase-like cupin family protein
MPAGGSHAPGRAPARSHRRWLYAGATADPDVAFGALDRDSGERFQALRRQLGVRSFGMNLIVVQPRQRGRIHAHEHQEEVYFVLERELTLLVEGAEHVVGPDRLVRVGPAVRRQLVNAGTGAPRPARPRRIRDHESRDRRAWTSWEDDGRGAPPQEIPLPDDLPIA